MADAPPPKRAERPHEHFCALCFSGPKARKKRRGGYWRCFDAKCTLLPSQMCAEHTERFAASLRQAILEKAHV